MKKAFVFLLALLSAGTAHAYDVGMIDIHGFASQGYLISSDHDFWFANTEDGTFDFNEIGLNVMAEPVENLRIGVQFLSRDLGNVGNNGVKIDWAYGDYYFREWLGVRAGVMKRPHGLYNQCRDIDAARTGIFLPTGIYPEGYRDWIMRTQGVGIYGTLPGDVFYELQYGTFSMDTDGSIVKSAVPLLGGDVNGITTDDIISFGLRWSIPLSGLRVGVSGSSIGDVEIKRGARQMNVTRYDIWCASAEYNLGGINFSAEYLQFTYSVDINGESLYDDAVFEGWYVAGARRFTDWFELGLGYSASRLMKDGGSGERFEATGRPDAMRWLKDLSLSARFDINNHWIFKLEGHYMRGLSGVTSGPGEDPEEDWFLFAVKTTFTF